MSLAQAKVQFGNKEIQNPFLKVLGIALGLLIAASVVGIVIFFVLPIVGAVVAFVAVAIVSILLALVALVFPFAKKFKNKEFKVDISDDGRDYNISLDQKLTLPVKALNNIEIILEKGKVKVGESPTGDIICKSEKGVIGYLEEGSNIYLKGLGKEEDQFEVLIPRNINIQVKIGSGELDLREVPVALKVQMGLGKITAYSTLSDLNVESGNAKVYAHDLIGNADLKLGMGEVVLDVTPTGLDQDILIKSAKVDAKIVLPEGIPVNANADGLKVTIDSDLPILAEAPLKINMAAALGSVAIKEKSNLIYLQ
jgi:hypothetical protein